MKELICLNGNFIHVEEHTWWMYNLILLSGHPEIIMGVDDIVAIFKFS